MQVNCPICSNKENFKKLEQCGEFEIFRCGNCDLEFSWPMQGADDQWYDAMYKVRHLAPDDRVKHFHQKGLNYSAPGSKILDIGCGEGTFVNYATKLGHQAWGLDFSEGMIKTAQKQFPQATFLLGRLEDFLQEYPEEKFDAVFLFEMVEHQSDPVGILKEARKVLRPAGKLIVSVPSRNAWPVRDFVDYPPHHLTRWNGRALAQLMESAGFTLREIVTTSRIASLNAFLGYCLFRIPMYSLLNLKKSFAGKKNPAKEELGKRGLIYRVLGNYGSFLRRARDQALWIPTLILAPIFLPMIEGTTLVLWAEATPGEKAESKERAQNSFEHR